jgi:hypothetical protein
MTILKGLASVSLTAAALASLLISSVVAAAAPEPAARKFKVGGRMLEGRAKTICVIEGSWADGEPFRYEGWDTCKELRVTSASLTEYKDWRPRGRKGSLTVADIPPGTETIEISNDFSSVLVFRDGNGEMQEVLVRD